MSSNSAEQYSGQRVKFDEDREVFVGNNGDHFALYFINRKNVGQETISFSLSPEAAEFVANSILNQLYILE